MDVIELRIALESVLIDRLGTYTYANGSTSPALSVRSIGEAMPANTKVQGLEAILRRDPTPEPVQTYQHQKAILRWTLFLIDWDGSNEPHKAAADVLDAFPSTKILPVVVPENTGPRSQLQLVITTLPNF